MGNFRYFFLRHSISIIILSVSFTLTETTVNDKKTNIQCLPMWKYKKDFPICNNLFSEISVNLNSHSQQDQLDKISRNLSKWKWIIDTNCSSDIEIFICSIFTPICIETKEDIHLEINKQNSLKFPLSVGPCFDFCKNIENKCKYEIDQKMHTDQWPQEFQCRRETNEFCINSNGRSYENIVSKSELYGCHIFQEFSPHTDITDDLCQSDLVFRVGLNFEKFDPVKLQPKSVGASLFRIPENLFPYILCPGWRHKSLHYQRRRHRHRRLTKSTIEMRRRQCIIHSLLSRINLEWLRRPSQHYIEEHMNKETIEDDVENEYMAKAWKACYQYSKIPLRRGLYLLMARRSRPPTITAEDELVYERNTYHHYYHFFPSKYLENDYQFHFPQYQRRRLTNFQVTKVLFISAQNEKKLKKAFQPFLRNKCFT
ncbi:hypothetical protein SNEBB_006588 [Seison nebaliae]|nr:hypothetical protein SNEBB_006588 [Seison nebaliae]